MRTPLTALALAVLLIPGSLVGQEVRLTHPAGEDVRLEGIPIREFASQLQLTGGDPEARTAESQCFVALVDSEGNVWQEYTSPRFTPEDGDLRGACVPRIPMTESGAFQEGQSLLAWSEGIRAEEVVFDGTVDWQFLATELAPASVPALDGRTYLQIDEIPGEAPQPPYDVGPYDWVALVFVIAPSGQLVSENLTLNYITVPTIILMGVNR